MTMTNPYL